MPRAPISPTTRAAQAAACFLVELGNGDKFLFDSGTGSHVRIASLEITYDFLDKIFISHLHTDHFGDFAAYYIGGWVGGRSVPLNVWGPSGPREDLGTEYALTHWKEALAWDRQNRVGRLPAPGGELVIHEFDYRGENQVVYDANGVVIRSFPAIHGIDGSVSYRMDWNDLCFVFGGDTYPNQWLVEYSQGCDIVVHEAMMAVEDYIAKYKFPPSLALEIGVGIHTSPESFGKVMSLVEPRMAVAYHFFNDFDIQERVGLGIRSTYDGPITLATDYMVWNVTKDDIKVREVVFNEDQRCKICYRMRLGNVARLAAEQRYRGFSTTLLYSTYQNHDLIKKQAAHASESQSIPFVYHDFRKGWQQGIDGSKAYNLYRQSYCGCLFSEQERYDNRLKKQIKRTLKSDVQTTGTGHDQSK